MAEEKKEENGENEVLASLSLDQLGMVNYRCNAPPVNPFEGMEEAEMTPARALLNEVMDSGGWRIDCGLPRTSKNEAKILESLEEMGADSTYVVDAVDEGGFNALHACAVNGYDTLFKAFLTKGGMDARGQAEGLKSFVSSRFENVRGPDVMWMAKRRGHKALLKYIQTLPAVKEDMAELSKELDKQKLLRKKHVANFKKKLEEEERRKKEEEERLRKEELARREKEEKQREFRETIRVYNGDLKDILVKVEAGDWQNWELGREKSLDLLKRAQTEADAEVRRITKLHNLSKVHEVERDMKRPQETLDMMIQVIADYTLLWEMVGRFDEFKSGIQKMNWSDLDGPQLEEDARNMLAKCKKLPKSTKKSEAFKGIDVLCKEFFIAAPLAGQLHSDTMRRRHWDELVATTGKEIDMPFKLVDGESSKFGEGTQLNEDLLVGDILKLDLHKGAVSGIVEEITDKGAKEAKQEIQLATLSENWSKIEFVMSPYKETDVPILRMGEEDFELLEADLLQMQGMVASRYEFWKVDSTRWQKELNTLADTLTMLAELQRMWSYLEPLFVGSDEVRKELPTAAEQFMEIDQKVRANLKEMWATKNAKQAANKEGLLAELEALQEGQEVCKKALVDFMDGKRRKFARFYFVSEADLLDILSNGSNPKMILRHVDKVFLNTKELVLDDSKPGRPWAKRFIAGVGKESAEFEPNIPLEGKVESYLQEVLKGQKDTLKEHVGRCNARYPTMIEDPTNGAGREKWVVFTGNDQWWPAPRKVEEPNDAAQVILLVAAFFFVNEIETAMDEFQGGKADAMDLQLNKVKYQLESLVKITRTKLTAGERKRAMCMITLDAHSRDMLEKLIREKATYTSHFAWMSQLKQRYVPESKDARIEILNASFMYDYEYLGNGARLVVTPLTDRIYVTATQALHLCMGCAPAGPAGTGKTESTKDLASALGMCCYVINCSPEHDYESMGNIFKGLAASGSWGCFDEFNRLIPEVLSVCSVQFKAVCVGVKGFVLEDESTHVVTVDGDTVSLVPKCGAFITMNPGYLGRSALPEGLKALFRPMTVMVPDLVLICENFLMAEGFAEAKVLASKFYSLYSLLKDLLSKQEHYDWGLRAIKSVLVVAGQLLRGATEGTQEAEVLMRALRDFNIPKIVKVDEVVFFGLLGDLFPGLNPERVMDKNLESCVIKACERLGFYGHETTVLKSVQLQELLDIRHCVFCMGPAGSAKSTSWKILQEARNIMKPDMKVKVTDLNPKVLPTQDLYGYINMATREWKDGLLSNIMRALGQIEDENPKWIMLDGDLDANWIESMNSVMDDNRMLTLASNERIPLKPYMRMIFEIRDLKHATPATTSRAGILYISTDTGFQWRSIIASWVSKNEFEESIATALTAHFEKYVPSTLKFFSKSMTPIVHCEDTSMVMSLLRFLENQLTPEVLKTCEENKELLEANFVFCSVWAFGAALSIGDDGTDYKKTFSDWWKRSFKTVTFPNKDSVFDYYLMADGTFDAWEESPAFSKVEFDSRTMSMSEVTVATSETASVTYWMQALVNGGYPIMLCGLSGTGKTQMVNGLLQSFKPEDHLSLSINMNFYSSGTALQAIMETALQKQTASTFGPPGGAKMVYFIDDLNLPMVDAYNTQSAIALVRQHLDYTHWYDPIKLSLKTIVNCQYIAAMNPTAGSFLINPRLQRWFTTFAQAMPNLSSLSTIYQTFLEGHYVSNGFEQEIVAKIPDLIKATLAVHKDVTETFRKTAANFHYEFNIRHLAGVFSGLLMAKAQRFNTAEKTAFVWCHECERVYGDRLVSYAHLDQFYAIMMNQAKKAFGTFNTGRFYPAQPGEAAQDILIFSHFGDGIGEDPVYDKIENVHDLSVLLEAGLEDYNETNVQMDLVLFEDAMRHICKITRVINNPAGHALLVGVGGSGKQSLSKLASHICGFSTMSIQISATYGIGDLKTDLQSMYRKAGINQVGVAFLFTDNQITNEKFLVYLNDLLNSGNIADLYAPDEKDTVCNDIISKAKAAGVQLEPPALYAYFISQVRRNLHVILCCSPVGDAFRNRCLKFPALVNCTVIDWFQPWPEEALYSVGKKALADLEFENDDARNGIEKFLPASFKHVEAMQIKFKQMENREVYTTPKSYLELLALYKLLLADTRGKNDVAQARLLNGIQKLNECASIVDSLKADVAIKLEQAGEKAAIANGIATTVQAEKEVVEMETENANIEAAKVAQIQTDVTAQASSAEADLAAAEPAVEAAMAALDTLDIKALGNCKSMMKPPPGVDDVFASVMVLMAGCQTPTGKLIPAEKSGKVREKNRDWGTCKKVLLGNIPQLVADLKLLKDEYDAGRVPHVNWKEVRPFIALEHFKVEIIMGKNPAAAGLTNFVLNIVNYYDIVVTVEPKRKALAEAKDTLAAANEKLALVKEKVHELQLKLAKLTAELDAATKSRLEAEAVVAKGKMKLDLAQRLIKALSSENVRWNKGVQQLKESRMNLIGDSLLSAAFISYIGPFAKEYRDELVSEQWIPYIHEVKIPMSDPGGPLQVLCTDSEIAKWNTQGLQSDQVSIENGAIVKRSSRWPLLIDPQLQGIAWIKTMEGGDADRPLQVVRLSNNDIMFKMTRALENGFPVLIENMGEKIDATLMPVVARNTMARGSKKFIKLGDDEVELHKDFQLYMHTKLSNPHYPPEIQAECTLVNFTVTPSGLEDQLLSLVVRKERPDLASKKAALIQQQNQFLIRIGELEDEILARLAAAQGDITEDVDLIEGLENAKKLSTEINKQLDQGKKTSKQINMTSEKYRPTARRGSQLFFIMQRLVMIHTYYIYSLNAFVVVFSSAIDMIQNEDKAKAKAAKGPKLRGLKKLQNFTKTIIHSMQRFPWSHNILLEASHASNIDMTSLNAFFSGEGPEAAKVEVFNVGDVVDTSFGVAKVLEKHIMPDTGLPKYRVEMRTSTLNGKPMQFTLSADSVRKYTNYAERTTRLSDKITSTIFNYVRRGLFEQDKLLVTTLLFFTLQVANDRIDEKLVNCMLFNSLDEGATVPEETKGWMNVMAWQRFCSVCSQLTELIPECATAVAEFAANAGDWEKWFTDSKPEDLPMPGSLSTLGTQKRMPFLRALRPDRVTFTLSRYISESEGPEFTFQPPFDMAATYQESSASTPIFFVLFPGVDPTGWVEDLGKSFNITLERGMFVNISMGQGQEKPAEATLEKMSDKGGWVMLQNLHLMQSWLPSLERKLEVCSMNAHQDFRCFISAEPPGFAYMKNIPESLLQSCIKVANEAPSDLKSNISRAWAAFDKDRLNCLLVDKGSGPDGGTAPDQVNAFKGCLFGLCFFHSVMLGRIKYGQQGWSRKYSFNVGDLTICGDVLEAYLRKSKTVVPWQDLRYVFGEIMYGGHITDFWDRLVDNNYLAIIMKEDLLEGAELGPGFPAPSPEGLSNTGYSDYVSANLPEESPPMYGLHENSEIAYLNSATSAVFDTILRLKAGSGGGGGDDGGGVDAVIADILERLPPQFGMITLDEKAEPLMESEHQPYVLVAVQECGRMNLLLGEIAISLDELQKGRAGQLNMTQKMEDLSSALSINQVPGRNPFHKASWEKFAWPSMKALATWYPDAILRCEALEKWTEKITLPFSLWIPGLFNPTSFLTAIKQVTARLKKLPLDNMSTETHITKMMSKDEAVAYPEDGAFVHGLYIEGARWQDPDEAAAFEEDIAGTMCAGILTDSRPRELLCEMPVMYIKAVVIQSTWVPESVGYIRPESHLYNCPVYSTTFRGPTFIFVATLKTKAAASKWISAGVALAFQTDG